MNTQVLFSNRPEGEPAESNFEIVKTPVPKAGDGQVVRETIYLSLDPYMRGRMSTQKSYAEGAKLGEPMVGQTVSRVIESKNPKFQAGDYVRTSDGGQQYGVSDGKGLRKLNPAEAPISWALGVLGMVGLTAYVALLDIGKPKEGETVVVSAAGGAVGGAGAAGSGRRSRGDGAARGRPGRRACPAFPSTGGDPRPPCGPPHRLLTWRGTPVQAHRGPPG